MKKYKKLIHAVKCLGLYLKIFIFVIISGTITADHIRASILSAVEDKVKRRLREDISQSHAEVDSLRKVQEELNQGNTRLEINKISV